MGRDRDRTSRNRHAVHRAPVAAAAGIVILLLGWGDVAAQTPGPPNDPPPSTLTLDRMDDATRLGVQLGLHKLDGVDLGDGMGARLELYGQWLLSGGLGVYGHLPFTRLLVFSDGAPLGDDSDFVGSGGLEGGAFFRIGGYSHAVLRAGLVLPTAVNGFVGPLANTSVALERLTDLVNLAPNTTALRLSASWLNTQGLFFVRGDLGLDLAMSNATDEDVLLRVNLAAGLQLPGADLSLESVNLGILDGDSLDGFQQRFLHTVAAAARTRGKHQLYGGMVFPLDEAPRGDVWILAVGYQNAQ
jgi:hypothetical protein